MKVKVNIIEDELYPYYEVVSPPRRYYDEPIEIDQQTLDRWEKAMLLFRAVQEEMAEYYRDSWGLDNVSR